VEGAIDATLVLVSELVANAACHAGGRFRLELAIGEKGLHVDVLDHSFQPPMLQRMQEAQEHGWGLVLVDRLADRWGYQFLPDGKRVWFELDF
jgi:anti-sigma regulatory factor (Ser/Thr protein kinase)